MPKCVVFGGAGVFGSIVSRELHDRGLDVTIAGRNAGRASGVAEEIGCAAIRADLNDVKSCCAALEEAQVAVNCGGPFHTLNGALLQGCVKAGCHYVDIADDRGYVRRVLEGSGAFAGAGLTAVYGCSSLPGISGALALAVRQTIAADPVHARVTLFIGNDNPKGSAAVRSAARLLGKEFAAPQGKLRGFQNPEVVSLPAPFGRRTVLNFESPDYDLLPAQLGVSSVVVKVGFELRPATALFGGFAAGAPRLGRFLLPRFAMLNRLTRRIGCSGGVVIVELSDQQGNRHSGSAVAAEDGQRMAVLPAVYAALRLCQNRGESLGAATAYELLGAKDLLMSLEADGVSVVLP